MARAISERAQSGFSDAASYDAHRPSYPSASVENLMKALNVQGMKHARILEIAAGTGKFTSLLAGQKEEFEIVAVEPHADMRTVLQGKQLKGVKVVEGTAESLGAVEDGWADGVVVAQVSCLPEIFLSEDEHGRMAKEYQEALTWVDRLTLLLAGVPLVGVPAHSHIAGGRRRYNCC